MRKPVVCLMILALTAGAFAQTGDLPGPPPPPTYGPSYNYAPPPPPGAHEHDGFYLRAELGFGGTTLQRNSPDAKASGGGPVFGVAVGGAITRNLILYFEGFDDVAVSPTVSDATMTSEATDSSSGVYGFGPGVAYYFMPINLYVSGTVALSHIIVTRNGDEVARSDWGLGLSLMVGKEWWVTDNWGLGVALQLYGGRIADGAANADSWSAGSLGLLFSATYN